MSISLSDVNPNAARGPGADGPPPPPPDPLTPSQVAGLDDPLILQQCQVGMRTPEGWLPIGLGLSGLYCAACAITIEGALAKVPGVASVQVQGATQRARITLDPARVRLSDLVAAVQSVGYRAWPDAGARAISERLQAQRKLLWRLMVAAFCMMQVMMISFSQYVGVGEIPDDLWNLLNWGAWVMTLPVMFFSCGPFFTGAWAAFKHGRISMDTPVAIGIIAMFVVSTGVTAGHTDLFGPDVYFDSLTMFVAFLLGGRWLEARARERVTQSLEALCNRLPEAVDRAAGPVAQVQDLAGMAVEATPLSSLQPGDHVRVAVGQVFPADGQVVLGHTEVDESLLTGESRAVARQAGQLVVAGSMNLGAPVWCRIERLGPDTRYQQIVSLVHQALTEKPGWMRAADRFSGPFLWGVLGLAVLGWLAWQWIDPSRAIWVAVSVLVVTCPCALALSAPSALLAAAGALAKGGVLVRRLDALEALAAARTVLFDKTGTLTDAHPTVDQVWSRGQVLSPEHLDASVRQRVSDAASLAALSTHPLSRAVVEFSATGPEAVASWVDVTETAGQGLSARDAQGRLWRLGGRAWVLGDAPAFEPWPLGRVWFGPWQEGSGASADEALAFSMDEQLRPEASAAVAALSALGVQSAVLSGDHPDRVEALVRDIGGDPPLRVAAAAASPERKLEVLQQEQSLGCVAVVGDGINDAPVLARAHVSFALDQGAALAQSQADLLVLGGRLTGVGLAVQVSRKAMRIVRQNMMWSASYNFVCIPLALAGYLPPWLAGVGMALSSVGVILNALRLGR